MRPLFADGLDVGDVAGLIGGGISLGTVDLIIASPYDFHSDNHQCISPYLCSLL